MGWWKVQGTNDLVGDEAFSLLRNAAIAVAAAYHEQCARPPTRSEWERLLQDAVQPIESLESTSLEPMIADAQGRPSAVRIAVETKE
jgi:hypothetical protein